MNKFKKLLIAILFVALTFCVATACGEKKSNAVKNKFVVYGDQVVTVSGSAGKDIKFPEDPLRNGYLFDGWYTDEAFSGDPVTSGKYDGKTVYYAKWAVACRIEFDVDGGVLPVGYVLVKEGSTVLTAVADYSPVKGDLKFGGWFLGDEALADDIVATESGLTITAKYKAAFTVNAAFEAIEGADEVKAGYIKDYAFVGDNLEDYAAVHGFTAENADEFTITENASENVFDVTYSRNRYNYTVYEYYPDGSYSDPEQRRYYYEANVPVPTKTLFYEGYLFVGWATRKDAAYNEALKGETFRIDGDVTLYPVWDRGYSDMFGGGDYIFVDHENPNKVTLRRGGVDIPGEYDEDFELYFFKNEDESFSLKVTLDEETHRFIFYALRGGTYYLWDTTVEEENKENSEVYIDLDDTNKITYGSRVDGDKWLYKGTYEITSDGMYRAALKNAETQEEKTITFLLATNSATGNTVFRIRGDEYLYGSLARRLNYYPLISLDGFGNATIATTSQSYAYFYEIKGDVVTLASTAGDSVVIKIKDYDGKTGYDFYDKDLDVKMFCEAPAKLTAELTLDGCETAVYKFNDETYTGTYTAVASLLGGNIITVKTQINDKTVTYVYRSYDKVLSGRVVAVMFVECGEDYKESYFVDDTGSIKNKQVLVTENGTAKFYEVKDSSSGLAVASEGTITQNADGFYTFTANAEKTAEWAAVKSNERVFGTFYTGKYNVYYFLEEDGVKAASTTDYVVEGGATVRLVSAFGIYTTKDGYTVAGLASIQKTYIVITDGSKNYYFGLKENDSSLTLLDKAPMVLTKRYLKDGKATTDSNSRLTLTGKKTGDAYDAVYSVTTDGNTALHEGLAKPETLVYPGGLTLELYTFTSNDDAYKFRFYISQGSTIYGTVYYYNYYAVDDTIVFAEISALDDGDIENDGVTLKFIYENGKTALEYGDGTNVYKGSFDTRVETAKDGTETIVAGHLVKAFGKDEYTITAYNFKSADGGHDFTFTLLSDKFRISAENAEYTGEGKEKLELDGATHVARYTDKNGKQSYAYYIVTSGVLETDGKAIMTAVGYTTVIFDVKSDMTMEKRGNEAGGYVVVDNGELSGVAVKLDGHGSATIVYSDKDKADETATYTITDDIVTVMKGETPVYIGKIGVYTEKGKDYPALRLDVKGTVGAYLDQTDLSVIVLDDNGNATRYSSYGAKEIGYYYMIDDGVFYYADKELTNAYMYVVDGNVVRSSDFFASYYASDFASVVFYTNGIVRYNNNPENDKYYTYDEVTHTGRLYTKVESGDKNRYGYSYEGFSLNKNDKGEYDTLTYNDGNKERTYYYFNRQYITLTDATGDKTLEFQPTGLPTFTVEATLTTKVTTKDENGKDVVKYEKQSYYVILTYDKDGEPHTYLAKGVAGQVNGSIRANNGSYTYVYTEQYDLTADFGAKTFSFTPDTYKRSFRAYDYTYLYLLANGYQLESQYGIMQIVENVEGGVSNYTISGAFKYFPELDAEGKPVKKDNKTVVRDFTFENGKLSKAGYANGRYGHSYVAEFVVDGETYHMTFYLMPSGTFQKGIYAYQIAYVTKVTDKITVDAANDTVYFKEKLIYSGSRVSKGKGEDGAALYYEVGDEFLPSLRYNGEIVNAYFTEFKDGSWHFASQVYNVTSGVDYHYYYTPALDADNNEIDGGTVLRTRYYYATTGDKDKVYFLVDDDYNVVKVLSVTFCGNEETTAVAGCKKTGENVFEIVAGDKTYVLTFTKETGEDGATTINVAMAEKAADAENAA